jgi:GNAT superfamily N-acetyltransferase
MNAEIKHTVYPIDSQRLIDDAPFLARDVAVVMKRLGLTCPLVMVTSIFVPKDNRSQGIGSRLIQDLCERYSHAVIVLEAGALMEEMGTMTFKDEEDEIEFAVRTRDRLVSFYTRLGFVDCNDHVGCSQYKPSMIYPNTNGIQLVNHFKSIVRT